LKNFLPTTKLINPIMIMTPIPEKKESPTAAYIKYIPTPINNGRIRTPPRANPK